MLLVVLESIFIFHLISIHQNEYNIKIDKRKLATGPASIIAAL